MGIDASRQDENGNELQHVDDAQGVFMRVVIGGRGFPQTVCLRFIDPFGDTLFNYLQMPVLAEEIAELRKTMRQPDVLKHLGKLERLVCDSQNQAHTYIKFIGD